MTTTTATARPRRRTTRAWLDREHAAIYVFGTGSRSDAVQHVVSRGVRYRDDHGTQRTFRPLLDPDRARTGWFRLVPGCPDWCGAGHPCHYHEARPGSRGAFPYVLWWSWHVAEDGA